MISTVEKVRRLEQYIAADSSVVDPVINMAIDKLLMIWILLSGRLPLRCCRMLKHDWHYCKMDMTHESIHSTTL
ncbi:MAG: hypothetical protein JRE47_15685 [Deltaproteobacteria bacterium]|nr:hypothetical protein [Deltaproteobacteria bacterium]